MKVTVETPTPEPRFERGDLIRTCHGAVLLVTNPDSAVLLKGVQTTFYPEGTVHDLVADGWHSGRPWACIDTCEKLPPGTKITIEV